MRETCPPGTLAFIWNQALVSYWAVKPLTFKRGPVQIQIWCLFEEIRYLYSFFELMYIEHGNKWHHFMFTCISPLVISSYPMLETWSAWKTKPSTICYQYNLFRRSLRYMYIIQFTCARGIIAYQSSKYHKGWSGSPWIPRSGIPLKSRNLWGFRDLHQAVGFEMEKINPSFDTTHARSLEITDWASQCISSSHQSMNEPIATMHLHSFYPFPHEPLHLKAALFWRKTGQY